MRSDLTTSDDGMEDADEPHGIAMKDQDNLSG
jgi:hypothetical protein